MGIENITTGNVNPHNEKTPPEKKVADDNENKKMEKERIDKSRRAFIKGALTGTAATVATYETEKYRPLKKAVDLMNKLFDKLAKRKEAGIDENDEQTKTELEQLKHQLRQETKNKFEISNIADYYLKAFEDLKSKKEFFPKEIFTRNLLIAQQLQESGYKADAKSHAGAIGVMQNMDISIKDVSQFLEKLDRNNVISYNGPIYQNPKASPKIKEKRKKEFGQRILKASDFIALEHLRVDNPDYSKALGKLYLMRLWNKKYGYGAGQNEYAKGDNKGAQAEILGAYNAGYGRVKDIPRDKWKYSEPRKYVDRIFNYMERLKNIRDAMAEAGLDKNNDSIAMRIAREMNKVRGRGNTRKKLLKKTMDYLINHIKQVQDAKGRKLNESEIIKIFSTFAKTKDISKEQFYT